jgi:hypothetical protein
LIRDQLKEKVVFDPQVVVYHHRRPLFGPHLRQIWHYGYTKAGLLKRHFTLGRLRYGLPSVFLSGLMLGPLLSVVSPIALVAFLLCLVTYLLMVFAAARNASGTRLALLVALGIPLTHIAYGAGFLLGLARAPTRRAR